jgi:predicted MPP superfamily phosphohydrolase
MRLAWLTDIHLNFLAGHEVYAFAERVAESGADGVLISGDIGEAHDCALYLQEMAETIDRPAYFVLGNHDFYGSSIDRVRARIGQLDREVPGLHWLTEAGVVSLSADTALIGHEGWADGRSGDYWRSDVMLTDYVVIEDLAGLNEGQRLEVLNRLGDEAAAHFTRVLPEALATHKRVIAVTHPPPFREACWYRGRISTNDWLPHMTCQAVGDAMFSIMGDYPDHELTVLCGHTHGRGETTILNNIHVFTGGAEYGSPAIQRLLETS